MSDLTVTTDEAAQKNTAQAESIFNHDRVDTLTVTINGAPDDKMYALTMEKHTGVTGQPEYWTSKVMTQDNSSKVFNKLTLEPSDTKKNTPLFKLNQTQFEELKKGDDLTERAINTMDTLLYTPHAYKGVTRLKLEEKYEQHFRKFEQRDMAISPAMQSALAQLDTLNTKPFESEYNLGGAAKAVSATKTRTV